MEQDGIPIFAGMIIAAVVLGVIVIGGMVLLAVFSLL